MRTWIAPFVAIILSVSVGAIGGWFAHGESVTIEQVEAPTTPSKAELDAERCAAALEAAGSYRRPDSDSTFGSVLSTGLETTLREAVERYCD